MGQEEQTPHKFLFYIDWRVQTLKDEFGLAWKVISLVVHPTGFSLLASGQLCAPNFFCVANSLLRLTLLWRLENDFWWKLIVLSYRWRSHFYCRFGTKKAASGQHSATAKAHAFARIAAKVGLLSFDTLEVGLFSSLGCLYCSIFTFFKHVGVVEMGPETRDVLWY